MLKELVVYIKTISKNTIELKKQELEQSILFWVLKGIIGISALVFLEISLFSLLVSVFEIPLAAFIIAVFGGIILFIIHSLQKRSNKNMAQKADEQLQLLTRLFDSFIDGIRGN